MGSVAWGLWNHWSLLDLFCVNAIAQCYEALHSACKIKIYIIYEYGLAANLYTEDTSNLQYHQLHLNIGVSRSFISSPYVWEKKLLTYTSISEEEKKYKNIMTAIQSNVIYYWECKDGCSLIESFSVLFIEDPSCNHVMICLCANIVTWYLHKLFIYFAVTLPRLPICQWCRIAILTSANVSLYLIYCN